MKIKAALIASTFLGAGLVAQTSQAQVWSDNFDGYSNGTDLHNVGGWAGWDGTAAATALVSNAQSSSGPNAIAVAPTTDIVQQFAVSGGGVYAMTGEMYIPGNATGDQFFIVLNTYTEGGPPKNWSTQIKFDNTAGTITGTGDASGTPITDEWVPFELEIDLDNDQQSFTYGENVLYTDADWSTGGSVAIGALDLFSAGGDTVYYDNLSLDVVPEPSSLALLGLGGLLAARRRRG